MIINPQNLRGIYVSFNTLFNQAFSEQFQPTLPSRGATAKPTKTSRLYPYNTFKMPKSQLPPAKSPGNSRFIPEKHPASRPKPGAKPRCGCCPPDLRTEGSARYTISTPSAS